ncbi:MAG: YqeG family HAD IIIA-type phosphatase [Oscillospiraceae bacterium]|nr:YqeG family HAD IIIA-type phosphatase [Oscillospiraceae bacterium]
MAVGFWLSAFFIPKKERRVLLSLLKADYRFDCILDITPEDIKRTGAKFVLLDTDNTLALHGSQKPLEGISEWIENIRKNGIEPIILSNNDKERIEPFAKKLGIPFVYKSAKPLKKGFKIACKKLGAKPCETAVIGDQLFTDVLGGRIFGSKVFLTEPLGPETNYFIKIKRIFEKPFR